MCMCVYIYIYIYIYIGAAAASDALFISDIRTADSKVLVTLLTLSESSACRVPICAVSAEGLTINTKKWFLGAGFLGALPISYAKLILL